MSVETLDFLYATMDAGKSARLMMEAHALESRGKEIIIFKPSQDTRDGDKVKSRAINTEMDALVVGPNSPGRMFALAAVRRPRKIFVDEVQFFTEKQILELSRIVDKLQIPVRCFGLLTDFKGELFPGSKKLLEVADNREFVNTECTECTRPGVFNARFINGKIALDGEVVKPGANELYRVLCRSCYYHYNDSQSFL